MGGFGVSVSGKEGRKKGAVSTSLFDMEEEEGGYGSADMASREAFFLVGLSTWFPYDLSLTQHIVQSVRVFKRFLGHGIPELQL